MPIADAASRPVHLVKAILDARTTYGHNEYGQ